MMARSRIDCSRLKRMGRTRPDVMVRLFTEAILLQAPVQGAPAHPELFGGQSNIAAVPGQHLLDEHAFGVLERRRLGRVAARCGTSPRWRTEITAAVGSAIRTARSTLCASSRTLPGHRWLISAARAESSNPVSGLR